MVDQTPSQPLAQLFYAAAEAARQHSEATRQQGDAEGHTIATSAYERLSAEAMILDDYEPIDHKKILLQLFQAEDRLQWSFETEQTSFYIDFSMTRRSELASPAMKSVGSSASNRQNGYPSPPSTPSHAPHSLPPFTPSGSFAQFPLNGWGTILQGPMIERLQSDGEQFRQAGWQDLEIDYGQGLSPFSSIQNNIEVTKFARREKSRTPRQGSGHSKQGSAEYT